MSPASAKASASCCTAREPPSPEGLAPRLALSPAISASKCIPAGHGRTWTSADVKELQAVFEDGIRADAQKCSIKLNQFRGDIDDELEGEQSDSDVDLEQIRPARSSHTLKAVTERLKKHLSIDSVLAKRHSRSSIGTTDEEVERRAELRRIRQRRIQEELSNESIYDDDAKSLSSLLGTSTAGDTKIYIPDSSAVHIPLVDLTPTKEPYSGLALPEVNSPVVPDTTSPMIVSPETVTNSVNMSTTLVDSNESTERSHNSPRLSSLDLNDHVPKVYIPSRKTCSSLETTAASLSQKTSCLPIVEPEDLKSPWRLSFASEHRSEGLRKLSQSNVVPATPQTEKESGVAARSTVCPYVESGNRYAEVTAANPEAGDNLAADSHPQTGYDSADFGGVDGGGDAIEAPRLHEMHISQRLVSRTLQSSVSSPQLSTWGSHQRGISNPSGQKNGDYARRINHTEEPVGSIDGSLRIWSEIKLDISLLRSRSAAALTQPSTEHSSFRVLSVLPRKRRRNKAKVVVVGNDQNGNEPETQRDIEERKISTELPGLVITPSATPDRQIKHSGRSVTTSLSRGIFVQDDTSIVPSEASSFRGREEELENLQARFAERRYLSTPVSSKFREEFDKPTLPTRKPSVLARLTRLARRSYDGTTDGTVDRTDLLSIPIPSFEPSTLLSSSNLKSSLVNDDAEIFWGNAIKNSKGKEPQKEEKKGIFGRKKSIAGEKAKGRGFFGKKRRGPELSAAEQYQQQFDERMAVKELVMDSWEMEMEATAAKAKTKSRNIVKKVKPTAPDFRFPASWARFPSHDRHERVSSATATEKVDINDFANLGVQENGDILWCLSHDDGGHHAYIDGLHRKKPLGERFVEAVEKELYEFDTQDDQRAQTNGRRGSLTVSCELEYPELEILPLTLMGQEHLKKQEEKKEEFQTAAAKDEELDEIAKLLGSGFDGVMSGARNAGTSCSAGASDWEDEMVMSSSDEKEARPYLGISDPNYYADCVVVTKSTFASPAGTPGGTLALRTDILEDLLRVPRDGEAIEFDLNWKERGKKREKDGKIWSGEDWGGYRFAVETGMSASHGKERKRSLGTLLLSKSVADDDDDALIDELAKREKEVRDGLLKAVENAFGKASVQDE